jgi:hypothetical protein
MVAIVVADSSVVTPTTLGRTAGLLGGLCWIARAVLDGGSESLVNALHYGGLALLVVALLGIGGGLVSGLVALRVVVAVCLVVLAAAVLSFFYQQYPHDKARVEGILGALMVLYCLIGFARRRGGHDDPEEPSQHRSTGSHAA